MFTYTSWLLSNSNIQLTHFITDCSIKSNSPYVLVVYLPFIITLPGLIPIPEDQFLVTTCTHLPFLDPVGNLVYNTRMALLYCISLYQPL